MRRVIILRLRKWGLGNKSTPLFAELSSTYSSPMAYMRICYGCTSTRRSIPEQNLRLILVLNGGYTVSGSSSGFRAVKALHFPTNQNDFKMLVSFSLIKSEPINALTAWEGPIDYFYQKPRCREDSSHTMWKSPDFAGRQAGRHPHPIEYVFSALLPA